MVNSILSKPSIFASVFIVIALLFTDALLGIPAGKPWNEEYLTGAKSTNYYRNNR